MTRGATIPSSLQYLVPELQAMIRLWTVGHSHSQYLVPELRVAKGQHHSGCAMHAIFETQTLQYLVPELQR